MFERDLPTKQREGTPEDDDDFVLHPERAPGKSHHPDDDALRSGEPGKRTRHGEVPADVLAERGEPGKGADAGELGAAFAFLPPPPSAPQTPIMRHATVGGLAPQISRAELDALLAGSQGRALPEALRAELQRRLGDLDDVRVHVGTAASTAAKVLHADAFAVGRDIYFADGKFDPASADGQRLIAHEVAHTAQRVGPSSGANIAISTPGDAHEHAADAFADDFASAILPGAGAHATPAAATRSLGSTSFTGISRAPAAGAPPAATPATPATATFDPSMLKTGVGSVAKAGTVKQVQAMRMGSSVVVQTPGVLMNGTVALKPNTDPGPDVDAGWVQTVVSSVRIGLYYKDGELVQRDITRFESTRDGKAGVTKPWYEPPSRLSKTQPDVYPVAEDQPKMQLPAELNGAKLTEIQGADKFKVSLKVGVGTNLTTLQSFEWEAPWAVKLDADQAGTGGDVRVAPTSVHDAPATDRPANEVGTDEKNKVQTFETEAAAVAGLSRLGIQRFIREMPKHAQMAPDSYWHMVGALWHSPAKFRVMLTPIGSSTEVKLALKAAKTVELGEVEGDGKTEYSALAHMVYDPGALGPGQIMYVMINGMSQGHLDWPYESKVFRDVKWNDYTYNISVSLS